MAPARRARGSVAVRGGQEAAAPALGV